MQGIMHQATNQKASRPRRYAVPGAWCAELLPRHPYQAAYTPDLPVIGFAFDSQVGVHAFGNGGSKVGDLRMPQVRFSDKSFDILGDGNALRLRRRFQLNFNLARQLNRHGAPYKDYCK